MLVVCAVFVLLLLLPDSAHAWGPISHLGHGAEVLKNLTILGMGLQRLLARHPHEYLYGCVGADITVAKKYTRTMQAHCHSWQVGWQVLEAAASDAERAFAWGYLTHLAADVYSHNHFVPTQLIVSYRARALRHIYWEVRFDTMQDPSYRSIVGSIRTRRFPECDDLVRRVVARTIFSFRTNKRIFDSVLAFHDWTNWHRMMNQLARRASYDLPAHVVPRYNSACLASIHDVMLHGRSASNQQADPTGLEALTAAKQLRRSLQVLERRNALTRELRRRLYEFNQREDLRLDGPIALRDNGGAPD